MFGKLQRTSSENTHGVGLGLSICKQIVENFDGKIWVESEFGYGSKFTFTMKAKDHSNRMLPD
jgi:signal transduction histidine kinase